MNNFLPEDDYDYLQSKEFKFQLLTEPVPNGTQRRGVLVEDFSFAGNLRRLEGSTLVPCNTCDLLILIPDGYATAKLDSFYTFPRLKRIDGNNPVKTDGEINMFGRTWQFWSRHLHDSEWRVGKDGLDTYLNYIHRELRYA